MERYTGYKVIYADNPELSTFYTHPDWNVFLSKVGEYIVVLDADKKPVDYYCWTGDRHRHITYKPIDNLLSGKIAPRNLE